MFKLPTYVVVIMDGNGRWARQRRLSRLIGHQIWSENAVRIIKVFTRFVFSSENWNRPKRKPRLLQLFHASFNKEMPQMLQLNIRIRVIGDLHRLNSALYSKIKEVEHLTRDKAGLMLVVAIGYSGQWDIVRAAKSVAQ